MKIIYLVATAQSHVNPTLPIVQELVSRGVAVSYYVGEEFRSSVLEAGATHRAIEETLNDDNSISGRVSASRLSAAAARALDQTRGLAQDLRRIPELAEQAVAENADAVVYDPGTGWGRGLAHLTRAPRATTLVTYAIDEDSPLVRAKKLSASERQLSTMVEATEELRRVNDDLNARYGIPYTDPDTLFTQAEQLNIVPVFREFQPDAHRFDDRYLFIGPAIRADDGAQTLPRSAPRNGVPRNESTVYVSMGSAATMPAAVRKASLDALAATGWRAVLTGVEGVIGSQIPSNVLVRRTVSQLQELSRARLFITHGGMNSVMEAIFFRVPMILLPSTAEQRLVAERAEELGLGVVIERETVSASILVRAAEHVLGDAQYRKRLAEMKVLADRAGGYRRAADAIGELAERGQHRARRPKPEPKEG